MRRFGSTWGIGALLVALAFVAVLFLWRWPPSVPGPKERIEQEVVQIARMAEKGDVDGMLALTDGGFTIEGLGDQAATRALLAEKLSEPWIRIFIPDLQVSVTGPTSAQVSCRFIFSRSDAKVVSELAKSTQFSTFQVDGKVAKGADGEWRFSSLRYQRIP